MESQQHQKLVSDLQEVYKRAYSYTWPFWERAEQYALAYDSVIDRNNWPTMSEVQIPYHLIAVENALPSLVEYLFPRTNFLSLKPRNEQVPYETVRRVEAYYTRLLNQELRIREVSVRALKDALKLGTGYMRTKLDYITPRNESVIIARSQGVTAAERRIMEGNKRLAVCLEYVPFGQVLSLGNGHSPSTGEHIIVSYVTAKQLRDMYEDDKNRDEKLWMSTATPEDIIKDAKTHNLDNSIIPNESIMARLGGGNKVPSHNQYEQMDDSVMVPIVEFYLRGKVIHVANGRDIIFMVESGRDIESGLVKATPVPDSTNWFADSDIYAAMNLSYGINSLYNAMLDMMSMALYPPRAIDVNSLPAGRDIPAHEPHATYVVMGDARNAIQYLQMPPLPNGILNVGDQMQSFLEQATGQSLRAPGGSPGLVRSGVNAFESLMSTTLGREKMKGAMLDMNFVRPMLQNVINLTQLIFGDEETFLGEERAERPDQFGSALSGMKQVQYTITRDDFIHDWDFDLHLDSKMRNSMVDQNFKMAIYQSFANDPTVDQRSLKDWVLGDVGLSARLHATPEQIQQNMQLQQQQAAMAAQAKMQAQGGVPAQNAPEAQGMSGIIANA